jgi:hypothetical protein
MFGRRLLNNKHKSNNEFKPPMNNNKLSFNMNQKINEEIKFNEENETILSYNKDQNDNNKNIEINRNKTDIYSENKNEVKQKKKSVIVNKTGSFFNFSSGITLDEDNEKRGIYDLNSTSGNFLKDKFSSQNYYEGGSKKKDNEIDHIFAPLTQEDISRINNEKNSKKNNNYTNNKFQPKKLNLNEFNEMNKNIINNYSKKSSKVKNNDEIELNLEDEDPYCNLDESSCENQKIPKNKLKLMDKLGIDLEDEDLNKDIDNIIKDKVDRIKEVKEHQRKCLLVENLDGLYGKSQNPDDIIKGIYNTLNDENDDSEYEEEIDKWEKAQFKSGIKLNQLNLNEDFYAKNNNNEINLNYKYNNIYEKLNKKEGIEFDELINDISQIVDRDKNLLYNYVNKKNDYNIELNKIISNEKKLEKELEFYINQYCELKKKLLNTIQDKENEINKEEIKIDKFYVSE